MQTKYYMGHSNSESTDYYRKYNLKPAKKLESKFAKYTEFQAEYLKRKVEQGV